MFQYASLIVLFPLLGFLFLGLFGRYIKNEKVVGIIGSGVIGLSFIVALRIFIEQLSTLEEFRKAIVPVFTWITAGTINIQVAYQVDQLSILMTMIVTGVGFLIHVYSIGYMRGDRGFWRFFTYLNLFIFAMLNLVLSDNFVLMFLGWEGVGLCSYLLIGFWYDRKFSGVGIEWTGDAANKAFIVNRIGDFGFMLAMFLIFYEFKSLNFATVFGSASQLQVGHSSMFWITLLLFIGATGKSAQIPLLVWLPDAMAGPTPVSALIHAATMVTAGVYMVARCSVLYSLAPVTMGIVAVIGAFTAILAASIGLFQNDIKKVLAYSTVSQLGYMFLALGVGAFTAGIFHVMTHAFFKACLFLGSGSVIHALHEEQDIRKMGGLKSIMPRTYWTFLISCFAIAGFPPLSGFFSKDEILWKTFSDGSIFLWIIGACTALMTAFYMFRLVTLTFDGEPRYTHDKHPHESPWSMTIPLIILAALAIVGGLVGVPASLGGGNAIERWLEPVFQPAMLKLNVIGHESHFTEYLLMIVSIAVAIAGFYFARRVFLANPFADDMFAKKWKGIYALLSRKYYIDEIYMGSVVAPTVKGSEKLLFKFFDVQIVDGLVNSFATVTGWCSSIFRKMQTGIVYHYAMIFVLGIIVILGLLVL